MVLATNSPEYRFLQILAATYVWMWGAMNNAICISNPLMFKNCSQTFDNINDIPFLPDVNSLDRDSSNYWVFSYASYVSVPFYGFNSTTFPKIKTNATAAARSALLASCAANSTCTSAYRSTANASKVIDALVTTNANSVHRLLTQYPARNWKPNGYYGTLTRFYTSLPNVRDDMYGMHNGILRGIAAGRVNATGLLVQYALQEYLSGGPNMYEALIHTLAIGSFSKLDRIQSNINMTGNQFFTNIASSGYGLSTRQVDDTTSAEAQYMTKWDLWKAEAAGVVINNRTRLLRTMQVSAQVAAADNCSPGSVSDGVDWLDLIDKACFAESFISIVGNLRKTINTAEMLAATKGLPASLPGYAMSMSGIMMAEVSQICGMDGAVCWPSTEMWHVIGGATTVLGLFLEAGSLATPVGAAIGAADLFCALAPIAADHYKKAHECCSKMCASPACQTSANGCLSASGSSMC